MARESPWLLLMGDDFHASMKAGNTERAEEIFGLVTNRCAQLSLWLEHLSREAVAVPHDAHPCWQVLVEKSRD